jgi:hypothetical protein
VTGEDTVDVKGDIIKDYIDANQLQARIWLCVALNIDSAAD